MSGLYIHIPFCSSRCDYCNFVSSTDPSRQADYITMLSREIADNPPNGTINSIYIGGGTPSCLYGGGIAQIFSVLRAANISPTAELTIEVNPNSFTRDKLDEYLSCGINRVSMGLQSGNDKVLQAVGRRDTLAQYEHAMSVCRSRVSNISTDIILGLPQQQFSDVEETINAAIKLGSTHLSIYGLSIEQGTALYESHYQYDDDTIAAWYHGCNDLLRKKGFYRYEVSNWAKDDLYSRHNAAYWKLGHYIGYGVAAHSYNGLVRKANTSSLADYLAGKTTIEEQPADRVTEYIMLGLRTKWGISLSRLQSLNLDKYNNVMNELAWLEKQSLVKISGDSLTVSDEGYYVLNSILTKLI